MREPEFLLARGSSPVLRLGLPLTPAAGDVIYVTVSQERGPVLEYQRNGTPAPQPPTGTLAISGKGLALTMTQGDTLRLERGDCRLQLRLRRGAHADTFLPLWGYVVGTEKEGEI